MVAAAWLRVTAGGVGYWTGMVQSAGGWLRVGWKGPLVPARLKMAVTLVAGFCAMLRMAWTVSSGVPLAPETFAAERRAAQGEPVPSELTQGASASARVSIFAWGTVPPPAGVVALTLPLVGLTRFGMLAKAAARAADEGAPMRVSDVAKLARD